MEYYFRSKVVGDTISPPYHAAVRFEGVALDDVVENFRMFLMASGWHPDLVEQYVPQLGRDWTYMDDCEGPIEP